MLKIVVGEEGFNDETEMFELIDPIVLELEHSLVSLSKWEAKFQKPFLGPDKKTGEEIYAYLQMMIVTPDVDPDVLVKLTPDAIQEIQDYIDSPQSATTFGAMPQRRGRGETITSELIYYWMVAFTIPWEAQFWHLNRLFSLIRICNIKNSDQKPERMTRDDLEARRRLNEERRAKLGTTG